MSIVDDRWYKAEVVPPALANLRTRLLGFWKLPAANIGIRGNPKTHFRGFHRSRAFIVNSDFCTDRAYSVSAEVNRGGDPNWVCGMDITLPKAVLLEACARLDEAVRAGRAEKVLEWYGNLNGDDRVDGFDNIANKVATSDSSHLWHLHIGVARSRANEDHTDLFEILTGAALAPVKATQALRKHVPSEARVVETVVPADSGIRNWLQALHHWYHTPAAPGSVLEHEHMWQFRRANFDDAGRWETLTPGKTTLHVPRTLGY